MERNGKGVIDRSRESSRLFLLFHSPSSLPKSPPILSRRDRRHVVEHSRRACREQNQGIPHELGHFGGIVVRIGTSYLFAFDPRETGSS